MEKRDGTDKEVEMRTRIRRETAKDKTTRARWPLTTRPSTRLRTRSPISGEMSLPNCCSVVRKRLSLQSWRAPQAGGSCWVERAALEEAAGPLLKPLGVEGAPLSAVGEWPLLPLPFSTAGETDTHGDGGEEGLEVEVLIMGRKRGGRGGEGRCMAEAGGWEPVVPAELRAVGQGEDGRADWTRLAEDWSCSMHFCHIRAPCFE